MPIFNIFSIFNNSVILQWFSLADALFISS
jgi:hypothetical protein